MSDFDAASVRVGLDVVRQRILDAGGCAEVAILPVTKGFGPEAIEAAIGAGATAIGESYAQELLTKADAASRTRVHFIGQLQTNKVRQIAGIVDMYETVDRPKLAREIAKRAPGASVLIQVDTTDETGKGGCPLGELDDLVATTLELGLDLQGLMTVGPTVTRSSPSRLSMMIARKSPSGGRIPSFRRFIPLNCSVAIWPAAR